MKLASDSETLAEKKALILYILNKVAEPISNDALLKLLISIDNMNYFYFQQFLLDLLENKYIVNYQKESESLYELTSEGKKALLLVKDLIPGITKFKVDNNFKETLGEFQNEISITSDYIPHSKNEYSVECKITEGNQTLFKLELFAGSQEQAKKIANNWEKNAEELYPKLLDIITKTENN